MTESRSESRSSASSVSMASNCRSSSDWLRRARLTKVSEIPLCRAATWELSPTALCRIERRPSATSPNSSSPIPAISRSPPKSSGTAAPVRKALASCGKSLSATRAASSRSACREVSIDFPTAATPASASIAPTTTARIPRDVSPEPSPSPTTSRASIGPSAIKASFGRSDKFCSMISPINYPVCTALYRIVRTTIE